MSFFKNSVFNPGKLACNVTSKVENSDEVISLRIGAVWLFHGGIAAPLSLLTGLVVQKALTHFWVEIQTKSGTWYNAQFYNPGGVELTQHSTQHSANMRGATCTVDGDPDRDITWKVTTNPSNCKMEDIVKFIKSWDTEYILGFRDCKDFATALVKKMK